MWMTVPSGWLLMIVCQNEMAVLNADPARSAGSVLVLVHFSVFVNDLGDRIESDCACKILSLKMPPELGGSTDV